MPQKQICFFTYRLHFFPSVLSFWLHSGILWFRPIVTDMPRAPAPRIGQTNFLSSQGFACQTLNSLHQLLYCLPLVFPLLIFLPLFVHFVSTAFKIPICMVRKVSEKDGSKSVNHRHGYCIIVTKVGVRSHVAGEHPKMLIVQCC